MRFENETLDWLFNEQLRIDPEWSVLTGKGFTWWAHAHAQSIEVLGEVESEGDRATLVGVRTEVARHVPLSPKTERLLNVCWMPFASMSGPILDEQGNLFLCSAVRVHDGIRKWMDPLISLAAALQLHEAPVVAQLVAKALGGEPATSEHPVSGWRRKPDEIAEIARVLVLPKGHESCPWREGEFKDTVQRYMQQPPSLLASSGGAGFTVEFPYGEDSSLMRATAGEPHPVYGNGLLLRQSFPINEASESSGANAALKLNGVELAERPSGYGFGSYCYSDGCIHFVTFLPNAAYRRGLLPNFYMAAAGRAQWMSLEFRRDGWENMWDKSGRAHARSAIERAAARSRGL